jgi:WD40 repeat protein/tRNA A-37 threonylcarbamoyl transferase component Bud32
MSKPSQSLEEFLFEAALTKSTAEERAAFLDGVCRDNPALRARLSVLLEGHFEAEGFLTDELRKPEMKPASPAPEDEVASTLIGRYKLLEKIGEGGFGEVWMAGQREPVKRRVALKIIKLGMDTKQVVARFEVERQALAMMEHPNIAKVFDAGATDSGRPYFVMELVRGVRITEYCEQNHLPIHERLKLFIPVCHAIQHAHQKGIIHRDIKPSNILVTLHDGAPVPKVIDFGIAKATQQELTEKTVFTQFRQFIGTPAYISPEQAEMSGLDIDTRSDIYSLGVLLYELLTGTTPFDAKELTESGLDAMRKIIREREPVRPSTRMRQSSAAISPANSLPATRHGSLSTDIDWITMKCLEKDRTRRYETANGLAMDIQRYLNFEPVVARPPTAAYRIRKFIRRNKLVVSSAAVVTLALVLGTIVSAWQAVRATRARHAESLLREKAQANEQQAQAAQAKETEERRLAERFLYGAKMNLAQQAWDQTNIGRLHQLLDETADYTDRGFEWYYWQRQIHLRLATPDGHRIPNGSQDEETGIRDAASDQEPFSIKQMMESPASTVLAAAFSPDGRRIVVGGVDRRVRVWDAITGKQLFLLKGHSGPVSSVAFSPDGTQIATAGLEGTARMWNAQSGKELSIFIGHDAGFFSLAFSRDGRRIATAGGDSSAVVWDVATGKELLVLSGHRNGVLRLAFSPDGQNIVTGSADQDARIWSAVTGKERFILKGHTGLDPGSGWIWAVAFSPDGQRIVTGCDDGVATIWQTETGTELFTLKGHSSGINAVTFSPDGERILTGSRDGTARLWDANTGQSLLTLKGDATPIHAVVFSPDGNHILTGGEDDKVEIWEAATTNQSAAWLKANREQSERQVALQRAQAAVVEHELALQAQDPGMIKQWLLLSPILYTNHTDLGSAIALRHEQVPDEANLRPRAGQRVKVESPYDFDAGDRVWTKVQQQDYLLNFCDLIYTRGQWAAAYTVSYMISDTTQSNLLMKVGSEDESKVYLNGKEIYRCEKPRTYVADQDVVTGVELKAGLNVLVFKVLNETNDWLGSIRLTDASGQPVKGIRVTLTPPSP